MRALPHRQQLEALRQGLRELGYVEGKTIVITALWPKTPSELPELAALAWIDGVDAEPGTWAHQETIAPPWLTLWAARVSSEPV